MQDDPKYTTKRFVDRRTVLKRGVAAAPIAFAVTTRPARAGGLFACQAPSAFGSMNASGPRAEGMSCTGRTPGYWKQPQHFSEWSAPYRPQSTPGHGDATLFGAAGFQGPLHDKTLLEVLELGGNEGGYGALARHIVAALLNAQSGKTPVLSVQAVRDIWNSYVDLGHYEATAGVYWDAETIVEYLKTTMPL